MAERPAGGKEKVMVVKKVRWVEDERTTRIRSCCRRVCTGEEEGGGLWRGVGRS